MSATKFLDKLLDGVTVEWLPLGEIAIIYGGLTGKSKADFEGGNARFVPYKNIFDNKSVDFESLLFVKILDSENQNKVKYGDVLFTGSSETADEVGISSSIINNLTEDVYLNSFSFGVRFKENTPIIPNFSKYLFRSKMLRSQIIKTASGVTRFNISKERFRKIKIPIPCPENPKKSLDIQVKIAKILETSGRFYF